MSKTGRFPIFKLLFWAALILSLLGYSVKCESDKVSFNKKHGSGCIFNRR